jgi:hypothetical protein
MHINLGLAMQFAGRYFERPDANATVPPSMVGGEIASTENTYLMTARTGAMKGVGFRDSLEAYQPLAANANVMLFQQQVELLGPIVSREEKTEADESDLQAVMAMGQCFAAIAYGQLVAEHASRLELPTAIVSAMFSLLVNDLNVLVLQLAALSHFDAAKRQQLLKIVRPPQASVEDWNYVAERL